jgi:hypothetical protein
MPSRLLTATITALASLAALPGIAHADSLTLSTSPDPAEDRPVTVSANGLSATDSRLYVVVRNAGGTPCGATYRSDVGGDDILYGYAVQGARQAITTTTFRDPGDYLLCGWLQDGYSATSATATTSLLVSVRENAASAVLNLPVKTSAAKPLSWSANVTTELDRRLYVAARPAQHPGDSGACGQSYASKVGSFSDLAYGAGVEGTQIVADVLRPSSLDDHTLYLVCAWVQEGFDDPVAEAQTAAFVQVGTPAACARAQAADRKALAAQRRAQARLRHAHGGARKRARRHVQAATGRRAQTLAARRAACGS